MSHREADIRALTIDPDVSLSATLPGWVYTDEAVLEACRERVFAPSWQFVADLDRVREPGHVLPFTLLEGMLDVPLLLTRDRADQLHCISNVCTHRANLVCEHEGIEQGLRCRYHGRKFGLDGAFASMPEFEQAKNFPSPVDSLPQVPFGAWEKFMFASLAPAATLDSLVAPMRDRCAGLPFGEARFDATRSRDYLVKANWALYVENYLEGFHIPYVHSGLAGTLDYGEYTTELFDGAILQLGIAQGAEDAIDLAKASPDHGRRVAAYYWWLYPNTMFNVYPWGVSINVVRPLGVALTRVSFLTYVWDASRLDRGAGAGLDRVEREDEVIVEAVQRGLKSPLYSHGRYSPAREGGVHHFHRMIAAALRE